MISSRTARNARRLLHNDHAAQLVEFAVSLPLLVLFVVGIFDFSGAFTLKQRLTVLARDAARFAAASPTTDLQHPGGTGVPGSVIGAFETIDNNLIGTNLSDCAVSTTPVRSGLIWTYSSPAQPTGCKAPGLTIKINRGYSFPTTGAAAPDVNCTSQSVGAGQLALIGTCVSIQYAFPWKFGRVANVLGRTTVLPPQISGIAVALNEN